MENLKTHDNAPLWGGAEREAEIFITGPWFSHKEIYEYKIFKCVTYQLLSNWIE